MVKVVNVRYLKTPEARAGVVYVGRKCDGWPEHPLANPFKMNRRSGDHLSENAGRERRRVLELYGNHLGEMPVDKLNSMLADLWEQTERGKKPLGCWCWPWACHADLLALMLSDKFEA